MQCLSEIDIQVLNHIIDGAKKQDCPLGIVKAFHRPTGREDTFLVYQERNEQGTTIMPLAILLDPAKALEEYALPKSETEYDLDGSAWTVRIEPETPEAP